MQNFRFMKPYPLFKVEYEELVGRNESKSSVYRIYVKIAEPMNWFCLYVTSSSAWAEISLKKLKDIFDLYVIHFLVEDDADTYFPMFEVNGQIYKTVYTFPEQSCICGEQIKGNKRYAEFSIDYEKFDYIQDTVFFYDKGTVLVKGNQLFLDGELLYDSTSLKSLCDEIGQNWSYLDSSPDKLIQYLKDNYREKACRYICNGYSASFRIGG